MIEESVSNYNLMVLLIFRIAQDHPNGDFASRLATRLQLRILPFLIPIGEAIGKERQKEREGEGERDL